MDKKGMLTTCDYPGCDNWCFIETTGEGETDGGYTRWNNFEPWPDGWGYDLDHHSRLCPKHYAERTKIVDDFYERGVVKSG